MIAGGLFLLMKWHACFWYVKLAAGLSDEHNDGAQWAKDAGSKGRKMKIPILALLYVLRLSGVLIPVLALADKISIFPGSDVDHRKQNNVIQFNNIYLRIVVGCCLYWGAKLITRLSAGSRWCPIYWTHFVVYDRYVNLLRQRAEQLGCYLIWNNKMAASVTLL